MTSKQLIWYEHTHAKVSWNHKIFANNDFDASSIKVSNIDNYINYCYGSDQYIMAFIEMLKERIIRYLPELNKVKIILGVFNKNKLLHRLVIGTYELICDILGRKFIKKNFYKSIITIIEYNSKVIFIGNINFNGID